MIGFDEILHAMLFQQVNLIFKAQSSGDSKDLADYLKGLSDLSIAIQSLKASGQTSIDQEFLDIKLARVQLEGGGHD